MSAQLSPTPLLSAFQESYPEVVRFIARRTGSVQDARELAHDTWIRLAERGASDEAPPAPAARAYVYTVAENIAIDHLRRRQRGHERFTPQRAEGEAPLREPLTPDIAERLGHRQALDAVAAALAALPARSRDIFLADRLDGVSHAELAAQHGVSVKTIEREVMRAMDGVEAALHRWRGEAVPPARTGRRRALSALLGVAGMGVGSAGVWQAWRRYVPEQSLTLATAPGRIRQQTLPDGSRLTLDAATQLEVAYYAARRTTRLLAGSVFFDVARDPQRPFTIAAGAHEVTVLGTRFEVALKPSGDLQVAVESGQVRVRSGTGAQCVLGAGERARIEGAQLTVSRDGDAAAVAPWREGWLDFQHTPLGEVVARLARYGTQPIEVAPEVAQLPVVGRVRIADSRAWLRLLPGSLPVQVRERRPGRSLVIEGRG